jgi:hypothetical protein
MGIVIETVNLTRGSALNLREFVALSEEVANKDGAITCRTHVRLLRRMIRFETIFFYLLNEIKLFMEGQEY